MVRSKMSLTPLESESQTVALKVEDLYTASNALPTPNYKGSHCTIFAYELQAIMAQYLPMDKLDLEKLTQSSARLGAETKKKSLLKQVMHSCS